MDRRKAMILATGAAAGGGACILALTTAFKPKIRPADQPKKLESGNANPDWKYSRLNPATTADMAYGNYAEGSCMYAVCKSVVSQLADQFGEPYSSFPCHMMKYGHGGIGGFGTVCGALNGAAAIIGLLVADKESQNALITDLFRWYEQTPLPKSSPPSPRLDFAPPASTAGSALCHASTTNWANVSGYGIGSKQRKERCSRLTGDVASQLVTILNAFFDNTYTAPNFDDETARTCMTCHGKEGKLKNTSGQMSCTSCHSKSPGHRLFADVHYKCMREKK